MSERFEKDQNWPLGASDEESDDAATQAAGVSDTSDEVRAIQDAAASKSAAPGIEAGAVSSVAAVNPSPSAAEPEEMSSSERAFLRNLDSTLPIRPQEVLPFDSSTTSKLPLQKLSADVAQQTHNSASLREGFRANSASFSGSDVQNERASSAANSEASFSAAPPAQTSPYQVAPPQPHISQPSRLPEKSQSIWRRLLLLPFKRKPNAHLQLAPPPKKRSLGRALVDLPLLRGIARWWTAKKAAVEAFFIETDFTPDLAENIGSRTWCRGAATFAALMAVSAALWPGFAPMKSARAVELNAAQRDEFYSQMIEPLALGADNGHRMSATDQVLKLTSVPERPQVNKKATITRGDNFAAILQRSGVSSADSTRVAQLVAPTINLHKIAPGTEIDITLGRRPLAGSARPLDTLSFRARFDLELAVERIDGNLALIRTPIMVDDTPLRIRGIVGSSLYRSARSAGAPASAARQFLETLGQHTNIDRNVRATDTFDIIVAHRRAATGEHQAGKLLYAGIERGGKARTQLMRWGKEGREGRFYEASGVGEQRSGLMAPVPGRVSSNYGMRRHPVLGYRRMHRGMDFRARHGTPIVAVTDGRVQAAGRMGGCGNAVKLQHGGKLATRYCHMSRIAVRRGQNVRRGQVIGYVGSTGLSTGPHLHYEMYRAGRSINPASIRFVTRAQLSGEELRRFHARLATIKAVAPGAALASLAPDTPQEKTPQREIEKIGDQ